MQVIVLRRSPNTYSGYLLIGNSWMLLIVRIFQDLRRFTANVIIKWPKLTVHIHLLSVKSSLQIATRDISSDYIAHGCFGV